jgi:hypothetical protein
MADPIFGQRVPPELQGAVPTPEQEALRTPDIEIPLFGAPALGKLRALSQTAGAAQTAREAAQAFAKAAPPVKAAIRLFEAENAVRSGNISLAHDALVAARGHIQEALQGGHAPEAVQPLIERGASLWSGVQTLLGSQVFGVRP